MENYLIHDKIKGFDLTFKTGVGVFANKKIDEGTKMLLEAIEIRAGDRVLDLGCGYGVVGIVASRLAKFGGVVLADANIKSIRLAEENVRLNGVANAKVILSDGLKDIPKMEFDIIISNPPIHVGLGVFEEFAKDSFNFLKRGGKIYFVSQERLGPAVERLFKEVFGNYQLVRKERGYIISLAVKETK